MTDVGIQRVLYTYDKNSKKWSEHYRYTCQQPHFTPVSLLKDGRWLVSGQKFDTNGNVIEDLDKEREIFSAQAKESGKPDDIIQKMVDGKMKKYISEVTLVDQSFVKDSEISINKLLEKHDNSVLLFYRLEVGEGIEKKDENFAVKTFHSTAEQAATIAKNSNVKKLIIGHFSSRYNDLDLFLDEAKTIFDNFELAIENKSFVF